MINKLITASKQIEKELHERGGLNQNTGHELYLLLLDAAARLESLENDAARWNMFVTISHEVIKHPAHRENQHYIDAYTRAIGEGFDCVYAIDTAMQANKGE